MDPIPYVYRIIIIITLYALISFTLCVCVCFVDVTLLLSYRLTVLETTKCKIIVHSPHFIRTNEENREKQRKKYNLHTFYIFLNSMTHMIWLEFVVCCQRSLYCAV